MGARLDFSRARLGLLHRHEPDILQGASGAGHEVTIRWFHWQGAAHQASLHCTARPTAAAEGTIAAVSLTLHTPQQLAVNR